MKSGLCRRLAFINIKKNYRFFLPRILSEAGLLICFYIIYTLACDGRLAKVKGGSYIPTFMWMGAIIIGLLSAILIMYTNSFLMKQRKHEFGLYSVLGLEKKHICRVLFHESLICSLASAAAGITGGMIFYKLCSLAICKLLKADIIAGFYFITLRTLIPPCLIFIAINIIAFVINCVSIGRMNPAELISSASTGEKEPKIKWALLIAGIASLGSGYYISLTTENPLEAILLFFGAVLLVIAGTYLLFTAGSVFILKMLKKKDSYYYKPGNITSVSGLLFRMKQNAVGLASVAVLATGVLIMISTTFCLYSRTESVLSENYPQDYYISMYFLDESDNAVDIPEQVLENTAADCAARNALSIKEAFPQKYFEVTFNRKPGKLIADREAVANDSDLSGLCNITFISEETYVRLGGKPLGLNKNEVAVCPYSFSGWEDSTFTLFDKSYSASKTLTTFPINSHLISVNCYGMVVSDELVFEEIFEKQQEAYGENCSELLHRFCISFDSRKNALENGEKFDADMHEAVEKYIRSQGYTKYTLREYSSFWEARGNLYGMYGTLLFLGILLGIVCLFATVLIIYYKQISEGCEDRSRYQIMQKIGMTEREVKKTIRSQIMLVFFLPLVTAGIHTAFAFPILTKLMRILLLDSNWLFAKWCIIVYAAFAVVYALIYKITARTYYKIVY